MNNEKKTIQTKKNHFFNKKQNKNLIFQTERKETPQTHEKLKYVFVFRFIKKKTSRGCKNKF